MKLTCFIFSAECLFLLVVSPVHQLYAETETILRAGITREITDFDSGTSSTVFRGGACFSIADMYMFNLTSMQNRDRGDVTGTWFIQADPECKFFSMVLGNYTLHFGSGLMMGKKEFMKPDPFSRRHSFSRDSVYAGSQSGNPAYSFSGIACAAKASDDSFKLQLVPFYSLQRRFISEQQIEEKAVASSLTTVNMKTAREGIYNSPADIINSGVIADATFLKLFHIQAYGFTTSLQSAGGESIIWEKTSASQGIKRVSSFGLYMEYSDSCISIFAEPARSIVSGTVCNIESDCIAWGMSLHSEIFNAALSGKFSDRNFRSVYASGDSGSENILDFSASIIPYEHFMAGAAFYSEKDLTVNPGNDERRCFIREDVLASITGFRIFGSDFRFSRKLPLDGEGDGRSQQYSCNINLSPVKEIYLRARYTGQSSGAGISWLWGAELKFMLLSYFSLSAGYSGIRAIPDNPLYAAITPASENNMDITRFISRGYGWSVKVKYSRLRDSFFFRWCSTDDGKTVDHSAESALVLVF